MILSGITSTVIPLRITRLPPMLPPSKGGSGVPMFRLRIEGGPRNGEAISLAPGKPLQLGRGREADLRFPEDATMSRIQAELSWDGSAWTLTNKSQHGTLINGARVDTSKVLATNDVLVLGGSHLVFEADTGAPGAAPKPAGPAPAGASTGSTPQPMPRAAAKEAAAAAAGGATPGDAKAAGAKPGAPAKKGGSGKLIVAAIVGLLLFCCCSGIIGRFVVYPRMHHSGD